MAIHSPLLADNEGKRVFALMLDKGDEAFACIKSFALDKGLTAASLTAIGAFERVTIGSFDFASKANEEIAVDAQSGVSSLIGDVD